MNKPKVLTVVGPTGSGKTNLSYHTAELLEKKSGKKIEIISADSRQIYKGIPIATAQPTLEEQAKYKHYFVNELELDREFNAADFGKQARELIFKITGENKIPVVVGGSGLYLSSLMQGFFEIEDDDENDVPKKQKEIRDKLYKRFDEEGLDPLYNELKKVDPEITASMTQITHRRVIRALQAYYLTGIPLSELQKKKTEINIDFVQIGIDWDRTVLYERINNRVEDMFAAGLIEEVRSLKEKGYHYSITGSLNTVGVKEVFDMLDDKITNVQMTELIKQNSRRYAKRQLTWFRRDKNITWLSPEGEIDLSSIG